MALLDRFVTGNHDTLVLCLEDLVSGYVSTVDPGSYSLPSLQLLGRWRLPESRELAELGADLLCNLDVMIWISLRRLHFNHACRFCPTRSKVVEASLASDTGASHH